MKKFYFFCLFILLLNEGFAQVTETFEAGTKTAYASADVTSTLYKWNLNEALLGTSASDRKNNSQSVRIRNTGKLTMVQSKASGLGVLSINHANYGSDLNATWKVEVSDDGGATWVAYVSSIITTTSTTLATQNFTVNVPGDNIRIRVVKTGGGERVSIDNIVFTNYFATQTITTSSITGSPFCITSSTGGAVTVPYTTGGTGSFNPGNVFTAQLSDAAGSFTTPTDIGSVTATTGGNITATIPAGTPSGTGYKIRVVASDPVIVGSTSATTFTVQLNTPDASGLNALVASSTSLTVAWTNPTLCFDEVMLVASTASITTVPTGLGSGYTPASLTYTSGYNFTGAEYLVYKSSGTSATVTGLTLNTLYYFKLFVRKGSVWSDGIEVSATPTADASGDYRTNGNATWNVITNWQRHNGTSWVAATSGQTPSAITGGVNKVTIRAGHTVVVSTGPSGTNVVGKLTIENTGKLWTNDSTANGNRYLGVAGDIICNGTIGNAFNKYDNISFNIEGTNQTISGTGNFYASRIRKNATTNATTNLLIAMNVALKFNGHPGPTPSASSGTAMFNSASASSNFNVTVNENATLHILSGTGTAGGISIDDLAGEGAVSNGGTFTINGTLNVPGTLYAYTNNTSNPIKWVIGTGGVINCLNVATGCSACSNTAIQNGSASAGATFQILNGGKLNLNGGTGATYTAYNTILGSGHPNYNRSFSLKTTTGSTNPSYADGLGTSNMTYDFQAGSTVEYSNSVGSMVIWPTTLAYSNLLFTGAGTKTYAATLTASKNVTVESPAVLSGGANTLNVGGDWGNYGTAGFTEGTGTVVFNGTTAQNIYCPLGENFYKATFSNAGTKTLRDPIATASDFTINSGSGAVIPNGNTISVAGNWANSQGTAAFTEGTDKVIFNGSGSQSITTTGGENFYDLNINNSATYPTGVTLASNASITSGGVLFIENGHLNAATNTLDGAGSLTMNNGTNLTLGKNNVVQPELTGTYSLTGGTINFVGTAAQTVRELNYFNLTSAGGVGATRILPNPGTVGIANTLTPSATDLFTVTGSTVDFNGGDQNVPGLKTAASSPYVNQYNILKTSTGGIKTVAADFTILDNLAVGTNTTLDLGNTNNWVTIKSDASATARVAPLTGTAAITYSGTGKFNIERYLPMDLVYTSRRWRLLTVPLKSTGATTLNAAWQEGQITTNRNSPVLGTIGEGYGTSITKSTTSANGFDQGSTNNPSVYVCDNASTGLWNVPAATNTGLITDNQGYMIFVRGDRGIITSNQFINAKPTNLRAQGQINTGAVSVTLNTTANTNHVIGNPYPSQLDMHNVALNGVPFGTSGTYYRWDPKLLGSKNVGGWVSFMKVGANIIPSTTSGSSYLSDGLIESGEAFLVKSPAGSITFAETDKATSSTTVGIASRPAPTVDQYAILRTDLAFVFADGSTGPADGVATVFGSDMHNEVDDNDAPILKTFSTTEKISLIRNDSLLSIETRKTLIDADTIFYRIDKLNNSASYQLNFSSDNFNPGYVAIFKDDFTKTSTLLNVKKDNYRFVTTQDASSFTAERFMLVFKPIVKYIKLTGEIQREDIAINWSVVDESYIKVYEIERSLDGIHFSKIATTDASGVLSYSMLDVKPESGKIYYYRIKTVGISNTFSYSDIIKVSHKFTRGISEIYIYPNPVADNTIGLQFNDKPAGEYDIKLVNNLGQIIKRSLINHPGGTASYTIEIFELANTATYHLEVINADKTKNTYKVLFRK